MGARFSTAGREDQLTRGGNTFVLVVLVAGQTGQRRSRTAATVAGTPGLQRADVVPEMVARMLGGGARLNAVSSGLRVAARRVDAGDRPRARRLQAVGKGRAGKGNLGPVWPGSDSSSSGGGLARVRLSSRVKSEQESLQKQFQFF